MGLGLVLAGCAAPPRLPSPDPAPAVETRSLVNSLGMRFVLIPAGTFVMGTPADEFYRVDDEIQHPATVTRPFYLQTTEVTVAQWKLVMGATPSYFKHCGETCPVEMVSWNEAADFIRRLNSLEKTNKYRLPTEAEWEYACRAGTTTAFYLAPNLGKDDDPLNPIAWYADNGCVDYPGGEDCFDWEEKQPGCRGCGPHPVGRKQPNPWGLYDMVGNVAEWCQDWYEEYPRSEVKDPAGPETGRNKVFRGGSWFDSPERNRAGVRDSFSPGGRGFAIGFRLVKDL
ncbi:MAG: formylglycine-generating enzyme family protein [Pseudomonadota bacterium]